LTVAETAGVERRVALHASKRLVYQDGFMCSHDIEYLIDDL